MRSSPNEDRAAPETPPTALTPAVHRRPVAGAMRAIPRRIHGVRLAITATARSERRIAVRGPGVGIDASSASGDPAGGPLRSTAKSCQLTHPEQCQFGACQAVAVAIWRAMLTAAWAGLSEHAATSMAML